MNVAERYELLDLLYDGRTIFVHRARAKSDGALVVLKLLKPDSTATSRLLHEYKLLQGPPIPGVVAVRALEEHGGELVLVREDVGGETLGARLARGTLPLDETLRIATDVADALEHVHLRRIIHKDINPNNIVIDANGRAKLIDFDIATHLPREIQGFRAPNQLAGTIAYISPEQTGRMNRTIDYRTDLYSLGATLYQMLTGTVPFQSDDPIEVIYCHIAKVPTPSHEVARGVPEALSAIVMKLLEKTAEARYHSAFGLKADLEECQRRLADGGRIDPFPPGLNDVSDRFQIPEKLYGRTDEVALLKSAFDRVAAGAPEFVLVSGGSGIGKSRVVQELYRSITMTRGGFVSGKFDQLKRDIPYSALLQAMSELIRGLLTETEARLAPIRARILEAVVGLGRVLTDIIPELTRIIGPQPPVQELQGAESGRRFRFVFERLLHVFTQRGEPLVIFLDDLQWADAATLELLAQLLRDKHAGSLLVIGSYRDNEVTAAHPLLSSISRIEEYGNPISRIALGPLSVEDVTALVADTLSLDREEVLPLAKLLQHRTAGNPLFVGELLTMLYKNGDIDFDAARRRWVFDFSRIEQAPATESVGQLMAARAAALSQGTQRVLRLAAVLGNRFELSILAIVCEMSTEQTASLLDEALREGLIVFVGDREQKVYRFIHDRVQQAIYVSASEQERADIHLRAGQLLLKNRADADEGKWLFQVLHHLNHVEDRIHQPDQRLDLARLNHRMAARARASGAFITAAGYCSAGLRLMPSDAWTTAHELMFSLFLGQAECEYMANDHASAVAKFEVLTGHAKTETQQIRVLELIAVYKQHLAQFDEATKVLQKVLRILDPEIPTAPTIVHVLAELLKTRLKLRGKTTNELLNLREETDERVQLKLRMFDFMGNVAFLTNVNLFVMMGLRSVQLTLEHGNCRYTASGYFMYAILNVSLGNYEKADEFGRLALDICARYPNKLFETMYLLNYGYMVNPWRHPAKDGVRYLEDAWQCGLMSGELLFAGYALGTKITLLFHIGTPLDSLAEVVADGIEAARKLKHELARRYIITYKQTVLALQGKTRALGSLDTDDFSDEAFEAELTPVDYEMALYQHMVYKMVVLYVFGRHKDGRRTAQRAHRGVERVLDVLPSRVDFQFINALLSAALVDDMGALAAQRELLRLRRSIRQLKVWAENAPMNYRHRYLLASAELARLTGRDRAACEQYDQAITLARQNGFQHDEAIALELTSRFFRSRRLMDMANTYLSRARQAYVRWGAYGKVALLDEQNPTLRMHIIEAIRTAPLTLTTSTSVGGSLDIPTIIKASQALSGEISLDKLLVRIMKIVAENAGADRGVLVLAGGGAPVLAGEFTASAGASTIHEAMPFSESTRVPQAIVNYVLRARERVMLTHAAAEGAFTADPYVAAERPKAVLCMPLLHKGELIGALYLENNLIAGAFTEERAELLGVLCSQMAISIENAHLYADLEQKVTARTRELREAQARVVQLEKEATEVQMAGGFAHEMRNALSGARLVLTTVYRSHGGEIQSSVSDNADLLKQIFLALRQNVTPELLAEIARLMRQINTNNAQIHRALDSINSALLRSLKITGLIQEYAQISRNMPGMEIVSVTSLVSDAVKEIAVELESHRITLEVDVPPACVLRGNPVHFHSMLQNLLLNARDELKQLPEDRQRRIRVQVVDEPGHVVLAVSDTGNGVPDEVREKIFEPFFSTKPHEGTGLGLGMVRKLASLYGANVAFENQPGGGAKFWFSFPKGELSPEAWS
jgi:histidine kinase